MPCLQSHFLGISNLLSVWSTIGLVTYSFTAHLEGAEPLIAEHGDGLSRNRCDSSHATGPCLQDSRDSGAYSPLLSPCLI
ncbi:hypothetical protein GQ607_002893 [Colletotrichum asianum]|uniref:Uncharacterized protein n=1 Tax=Colletotrichum asianum TaxID=702518 RepID=A0A8H3WNB0_9PEZI|nr:hypothetical protein GQ607_002893 [Colletotrichum asianum]